MKVPTYICDYCKRHFDSAEACDAHEQKCGSKTVKIRNVVLDLADPDTGVYTYGTWEKLDRYADGPQISWWGCSNSTVTKCTASFAAGTLTMDEAVKLLRKEVLGRFERDQRRAEVSAKIAVKAFDDYFNQTKEN